MSSVDEIAKLVDDLYAVDRILHMMDSIHCELPNI